MPTGYSKDKGEAHKPPLALPSWEVVRPTHALLDTNWLTVCTLTLVLYGIRLKR